MRAFTRTVPELERLEAEKADLLECLLAEEDITYCDPIELQRQIAHCQQQIDDINPEARVTDLSEAVARARGGPAPITP